MGYEQLKNIINQNRKEAEAEAKQSITSCPVCGYIKIKINAEGRKACPICEWTE